DEPLERRRATDQDLAEVGGNALLKTVPREHGDSKRVVIQEMEVPLLESVEATRFEGCVKTVGAASALGKRREATISLMEQRGLRFLDGTKRRKSRAVITSCGHSSARHGPRFLLASCRSAVGTKRPSLGIDVPVVWKTPLGTYRAALTVRQTRTTRSGYHQ